MIDADRLIEKIDEFNAVRAKTELEQSNTAVKRFDLAIKSIESHRADIENAGKVLKHLGMHAINFHLPSVYGDQSQRVSFFYNDMDGGMLRCGYATGMVGWLTDGSIKIGHSWSIKIADVRDGILHRLNDKVVDYLYDISYRQVVDELVKLARLYPEAESCFNKYFERLGQ